MTASAVPSQPHQRHDSQKRHDSQTSGQMLGDNNAALGRALSRAQRLVEVGRWLCGRSLEQALSVTEQAVALAEAGADLHTMGQALNLLGTIQLDLNLLQAAGNSFRRGREVALQTGDLEVQLKVANNAGILYSVMGDLAQAAQQFQVAHLLLLHPAVQIAEAFRGMVRVNLAGVYNRMGDPVRALDLLEQQNDSVESPQVRVYLELARAQGHLLLIERLEQAGATQAEIQPHLDAMQASLQALRQDADQVSAFVVSAEWANLQAKWLLYTGQPAEAKAVLTQTISQVAGEYTQGSIQLRITLGRLLYQEQDLLGAQAAYQEALRLMDEGRVAADRAEVLEALVQIEEELGHLREALALSRRLIAEIRTQFKPLIAPSDLIFSNLPAAHTTHAQAKSGAAQVAVSSQAAVSSQGSDEWEDWQTRLRLAELQARTDPLTGLYNRLALEETLPGMVQRLEVPQHSLYVLLLDIDHFKAVNDTYSHLVGDQVLQRLAGLLSEVAGLGAFLARYGGEELLVALSDISEPEAWRIAEQLRTRIAELTWANDAPPQVTVSIGLTAATPHDTLYSLLRRADDALYKAKHKGRNCVVQLDPGSLNSE